MLITLFGFIDIRSEAIKPLSLYSKLLENQLRYFSSKSAIVVMVFNELFKICYSNGADFCKVSSSINT